METFKRLLKSDGEYFTLKLRGKWLYGQILIKNGNIWLLHNGKSQGGSYFPGKKSERRGYKSALLLPEWEIPYHVSGLHLSKKPIAEGSLYNPYIDGFNGYRVKIEGNNIVFGCGRVQISNKGIKIFLKLFKDKTNEEITKLINLFQHLIDRIGDVPMKDLNYLSYYLYNFSSEEITEIYHIINIVKERHIRMDENKIKQVEALIKCKPPKSN